MKDKRIELIVIPIVYMFIGFLLKEVYGFEICIIWFLSIVVAILFQIKDKIETK